MRNKIYIHYFIAIDPVFVNTQIRQIVMLDVYILAQHNGLPAFFTSEENKKVDVRSGWDELADLC